MRVREYVIRIEYDCPPSEEGEVANDIDSLVESATNSIISGEIAHVTADKCADYDLDNE